MTGVTNTNINCKCKDKEKVLLSIFVCSFSCIPFFFPLFPFTYQEPRVTGHIKASAPPFCNLSLPANLPLTLGASWGHSNYPIMEQPEPLHLHLIGLDTLLENTSQNRLTQAITSQSHHPGSSINITNM